VAARPGAGGGPARRSSFVCGRGAGVKCGGLRRSCGGRRLGHLLATAACAAALVASTAEALRAQDVGTPPRLADLDFVGNRTFPDDSLAVAIVNRASRCRSFVLAPFCWVGLGFARDERELRERDLAGDIARLLVYYAARGFREARVDTVVDRSRPHEVRVRFVIEEGRPVRVDSIRFVDAEPLERMGLLGGLPLRRGGRLSRILLNATRDTLATRLRDRGYPRAEVFIRSDIPAESPYSARVTFDVDAGPYARFGPVTLVGNVRLTDDVILRQLPFEQGDEYSRALILEGQRNLYGVGLVTYAQISEPEVVDSIVPLTVTITEGDVHRVRTGLGMSTFDCGNAEGRWESRNLFGGARRLQVRARLSNVFADGLSGSVCNQAGVGPFGGLNWLVSADFAQPWVYSRNTSLTVGVFGERQSLQDVFVRRAVGVDVGLTRRLDRSTTVTAAFQPQLTTLDAADVFFCTSFLLCTPQDIDVLQAANWLSPVVVSLARDRTNGPLNPTRGYAARLDVEYADELTGSNFSYRRTSVQVSGYREVGGGQVLAARLRGGWVGAGAFGPLSRGSGVIHPQKRFYGGGPNSVRGFGQNQLGPRVLTVDVRRLIFPLPDTTAAVCEPAEVMALTCDASPLSDGDFDAPRPTGGQVILEGNLEYRVHIRGTRFEFALFADAGGVWADADVVRLSDIEVTPGLGFRYQSPVGPIRVDLGYRTRGGERLQVVTSQLRPFDPATDDPADRVQLRRGDQTFVADYVLLDDLALLGPRVDFGTSPAFSLSRLQLHFSIGQAF